jgi:hypothetical protein
LNCAILQLDNFVQFFASRPTTGFTAGFRAARLQPLQRLESQEEEAFLQDPSRELEQHASLRLLRRPHDLAFLVELGEETDNVVQMLRQVTEHEVLADALQHVRELEQSQEQIPLLLFLELLQRRDLGVGILNILKRNVLRGTSFPHDRADSGIRVEEIDGSITLRIKHVFVGEGVRRNPVLLQIKILDRGVTDLGGGIVKVVLREVRVLKKKFPRKFFKMFFFLISECTLDPHYRF